MHLEKLFKTLIRKSAKERESVDLSDLLPGEELGEVDEQEDGSEDERQNQDE
jgi:hypothetical protein